MVQGARVCRCRLPTVRFPASVSGFVLLPRVVDVARTMYALGLMYSGKEQGHAEAIGHFRRALGTYLAPKLDAADVHLDVDITALCERLRYLSPPIIHENAAALGGWPYLSLEDYPQSRRQ